MSFIEWEKQFETGLSEFDTHHFHLVRLINRVHECTLSGGNEDIVEILSELISYAHYHFDAEETWMGTVCYPLLAEHLIEHDGFRGKMQVLQSDFLKNKASVSPEVLKYLRRWLRQHILETDADYGRFYAATRKTI